MLTFCYFTYGTVQESINISKKYVCVPRTKLINTAAVCAHDNPTIRRMLPKSKIVYLVFLISSIL